MGLLIIALIAFACAILVNKMNCKANINKFIKANNASFAIEVEVFATVCEIVFKDWCEIAGIEKVQKDLSYYPCKPWDYRSVEYHMYEDDSIMPKARWNRRSTEDVLSPFRGLRDKQIIETLRIKYALPSDHDMRFNKKVNGLNGEFNVYAAYNKEYYTSAANLVYLKSYRTLKDMGYNLGKSHIPIDDASEQRMPHAPVPPALPAPVDSAIDSV